MKEKTVNANSVRVPATAPGEVTKVTRYGEERVVLIHPVDYARLGRIDELITEMFPAPAEPSEVAIEAYFELETPGEAVTDADTIHRLFPS
jgi:hypothetical protein